mgnify:FL=1
MSKVDIGQVAPQSEATSEASQSEAPVSDATTTTTTEDSAE